MTKGMLSHLAPKERLGYACLVCLLLFGFGYVGARHLRQPAPIVFESPDPGKSVAAQGIGQPATKAPQQTQVVVHVAGAVAKPGIVKMAAGSRVADAIHAAGGAIKGADLDAINLAAKLIDGTQIRVPTKQEVIAAATPKRATHAVAQTQIDKSGSFTPVTVEPSYVASVVPLSKSESSVADPGPTVKSNSGWSKKQVSEVNVNTASVEELQSLPGVGPSTAQKIFDFRSQHGSFRSADDLLDVPGIGPKKLEKMRAYVKI